MILSLYHAAAPLPPAPPPQEERLTALLELYRSRKQRINEQRARLLELCAAHSADVHAQEELLQELTRLQRAYIIDTGALQLALYGTVLNAQQVAAYVVGSYPYVASAQALIDVLLDDKAVS